MDRVFPGKVVVSGNFTASLGVDYVATATLTVTDPAPLEGFGFTVLIINGTATIGGVAYSTPGVEVTSYYHSGAWVRDARPTLGGAHTWTAAQTFRAASAVRSEAAATQDAVVLAGRAGGTSSYAVTLTPTTLTANRTVTLPDADIVASGSASALTSGRVPFVTTGGLLTDSAELTFSTRTMTIGGGDTGSPFLVLRGPAGSAKDLRFNTGATARWNVRTHTDAESGSDAGSTFRIESYSDAGTFIDTPFSIVRAAGGAITLARPVTVSGTALTVPNGTAAAPGIRLTSEASGLYRVSATSMGFATAGVSVGQWDTTATGSRLVLNSATSTGADSTMMCGGRTLTATTVSYGVDLRPVWAPTATSSAQSQGFLMRFDINATAGDVTAAMSATPACHYVQAVVAAGNVTSIAGFTAAIFNLGTGTLTNGVGMHVRSPTNSGGGAITNCYGIRLEAQNIGTNRYGIDIANISGGTTNFAIRTGTGLVSLGDTTASTSTATGALTVAGGIGVAGDIWFGQDKSLYNVSTGVTNPMFRHQHDGSAAALERVLYFAGSSATSATQERWGWLDAGSNGYQSFWHRVGGTQAERMRLVGGGCAIGTSVLVGSERLRVAGGTIATPTSTDVIIGGGALAVGATTASTSTTTGALTVAGGIGAAKEVVAGLGVWVTDGQAAPSATSGYAKIYVDTTDGDLKIIFGDGTIKTIVTDT